MMRLLSIGIDCVSSAIFVIPALAILQCTIDIMNDYIKYNEY